MFTGEKTDEFFRIECAHPTFGIAIVENDLKALKKSIRKHGMPWDFAATDISTGATLDPWLWAVRFHSYKCLEYLAQIAQEHDRGFDLMSCFKLIEDLIASEHAPESTSKIATALARGVGKGSANSDCAILIGSPMYPAATRAFTKAFSQLPVANPASAQGRFDSFYRSAMKAVVEDDGDALFSMLSNTVIETLCMTVEERRALCSLAALPSIWMLRSNALRSALTALARYGLDEFGESNLLELLMEWRQLLSLKCFASGEGKAFFDEMDATLRKSFEICPKDAERAVEELSGSLESAVFERKVLMCAQAVLANELRSELEEDVAVPDVRAHAPAFANVRL